MPKKKPYRRTVRMPDSNGKLTKFKDIYATTEREFKRKVREAEAERDRIVNYISKAYFGVWADKWLNEVIIPRGLSKGTLDQYKAAIKHLNSEFENVPLKNITLSDFNNFLTKLSKKSTSVNTRMSKRSLENVKKVAHSIFKYAMGNRIAGVYDFFASVNIPKSAPIGKRRALSEEEIEWIINTEHRAQLPAMIMLFTGLRRGELIPLEWSDIDLEKKLLSVNKSVSSDTNQPIIKEGGKTESATRVVPLPPILVDFLRDYKNKQEKLYPTVCVNAHNKTHTNTSWRNMWDSYKELLNEKYCYDQRQIEEYKKKYPKKKIPMKVEFSAHYLRHMYATLLYLQGVTADNAKQLLGHATYNITSDIYTDLKKFNKYELSEDFKRKLENEFKIPV